jgi:hypothetical protein
MSERQEDVIKIMAAYRNAEKSLREVGTLLRTTYAGQYMWSAKHKTAISGLCVCISALCNDVPRYDSDLPNAGGEH